MEITKEEIMNQIEGSEKRFIKTIEKVYNEPDEDFGDFDFREARDRHIKHVEDYTSAIKRDMNLFFQMKE